MNLPVDLLISKAACQFLEASLKNFDIVKKFKLKTWQRTILVNLLMRKATCKFQEATSMIFDIFKNCNSKLSNELFLLIC